MSDGAGSSAALSVPRDSLTVAVAQPPCASGDIAANVTAHAEAVLSVGRAVVVFPELSLTGYELDTATALDPDDARLDELVHACAATGATALVGAPTADASGRNFISTIAVSAKGSELVYRKIWLGSEERRRFHPGDDPAVVEIDGWRIGLAICKDTGITAHTTALGALDIDVYVAGLVMLPDEIAEQDERGRRIAVALGAYVAFAGFAGPTGSGYPVTAGRSTIWSPDGNVMAQAGSQTGEICRVTLLPRPSLAG